MNSIPRLFNPDPYATVDDIAERTRRGYLTAYRGHTRSAYETDLKLWFARLADWGIPVLEATRVDIETFDAEMQGRGLKPSSRQRRLIAICDFYLYAEQEEIIDKSPGRYVRRPRVPNESTSAYLERFELGPFIQAAKRIGPMHSALCHLLAFNGLRVAEAVGVQVESMTFVNGHHTLSIIRKGGAEASIPMAPQTFRVVQEARGDRTSGNLLLDGYGQPMSRHAAARAVRRCGREAGIDKKLGPHALRHTFVSLLLDAGVPIRDVQRDAGHRNVTTTVRYDRRGRSHDKHGTYILAASIGGF